MSGDHHSHDDIKSHIPTYLKVGAALFVLTAVTVGVGFMHIPSVVLAVLVGMAIACVKGGLVAGVYMHLIGEKKIIHYTLALTLLFFAVCLVIPVATHLDNVGHKVSPPVKVNSAHYGHEGHGHEAHEAEGHGHADDGHDHAEDESAHDEAGAEEAH